MGNFYSLVQEFIQTSLGRHGNWEPAKRVLSAKHPQKLVVEGERSPLCEGLCPSDQSVHGLPDRVKDLETTVSEKYPISPNFDFITCMNTRNMLTSAYNTITKLQKWDYLCDYIISEKTGYMFSTESTINDLMKEINDDYQSNHTGYTMGYTMRTMDFIAKNGFDSFRASVVQDTTQPVQENIEQIESSVVLEFWLHLNKKTHSKDDKEDNDKISLLEPAVSVDDDDDDEMPALEPVSVDDDDDDDEMPALEPVSVDDDDDDEMPGLIPDPSMHPLDPSFDFMGVYKQEAEAAYQTVQKMEMWNYLYNHNTDEKRGYMFTEDPKIIDLSNQIQEDYGGLHSGGSMALTLRFMELIAKEGFEVFKEECVRQKM